ncbi:MAG: Na+/H+ antiporter NhaC family protein [Candidatus Sericytochromatia bacterium]|nr:Na+/H+ antiporter NhaC family protein [Candidatus Sericytochromatia bacterium]
MQQLFFRRLNLILACVLFFGLCALFRSLPVDRSYLVVQTDRAILKTMTAQIKDFAGGRGVTLSGSDETMMAALKAAQIPTTGPLDLTSHRMEAAGTLHRNWQLSSQGHSLITGQKERRLPDWLTILPPLVAITLALATQRLFTSLIAGILIGAAIVGGGSPVQAVNLTFGRYLWNALTDVSHLQVFGFTAALLGMVTVFNRSGGTRGIANAFLALAKGTRSTQFAAWLMGLCVFFDDYANTMVVGSSMRPITDRLRISREKIAYIVDTTSAPVSAIAIISTWVGYQVGLIQNGLDAIGIRQNGFNTLIQAIPYRFYTLFTLTLLLLVILMKRDFGPMLTAERRARRTGSVLREGAKILTSKSFASMDAKEGVRCHWSNATLPVLSLIVSMMVGLFITGGGSEAMSQDFSALWQFVVWRDAFSNGSTGAVLCWAGVVGSVIAIGLAVTQRLLTISEALGAWWKGAVSMGMAVGLLTLAWTLNGVCSELGTAFFLVSAFKDSVSPMMVPALIFTMGAVTSFAIGSSWSTMAILVPTTLPLAFAVGQQSPAGGLFVLMVATGAVLDGAVFGDHCSPLADTTLMTSITTSCDLLDHVVTQLPYGLLAAVTAFGVGFVPAGLGVPVWVSYLGAIAVFVGFLLLFGRDPEVATSDQPQAAAASPMPRT